MNSDEARRWSLEDNRTRLTPAQQDYVDEVERLLRETPVTTHDETREINGSPFPEPIIKEADPELERLLWEEDQIELEAARQKVTLLEKEIEKAKQQILGLEDRLTNVTTALDVTVRGIKAWVNSDLRDFIADVEQLLDMELNTDLFVKVFRALADKLLAEAEGL